MALNGDRLGVAIAAAIKSSVPAADAPVTDAQLETMWKLVANEIVNEFTSNGVVLPGSFQDAEARPITGTGEIS